MAELLFMSKNFNIKNNIKTSIKKDISVPPTFIIKSIVFKAITKLIHILFLNNLNLNTWYKIYIAGKKKRNNPGTPILQARKT